MSERTIYLGSGVFEAARKTTLDKGQAQRLHGHSFRVDYASQIDLLPQLTVLCDRLNLSYLNELIDNPDNGAVLSWFQSQLVSNQVKRIQLWAGPQSGVTYLAQKGVQTWFRSRFEAAHYLPHVPKKHKCGRLHGHGFEVLIHSPIATSEQVKQVWREIHAHLHHQLLNDIEGLSNPTSEMLAHWIWHYFAKLGLTVAEVTVFETRSTGSVYNGQFFYIWKEFSFDSATQLAHQQKIIGHTYSLRVGLSSSLDEVFQWVEDFGDVKKIFSPLIDQLDHQPLHEILATGSMTECLAWLTKQALGALPKMTRLSVWHTPQEGLRQEYTKLPLWVE
ncbi:MAG: 6-carboxytetrahydropterin synthase [Betaproteobacteria bacterium]|nr:6-carboxytetrahydropterin synthase [Betaproteobacteria bacterium]